MQALGGLNAEQQFGPRADATQGPANVPASVQPYYTHGAAPQLSQPPAFAFYGCAPGFNPSGGQYLSIITTFLQQLAIPSITVMTMARQSCVMSS